MRIIWVERSDARIRANTYNSVAIACVADSLDAYVALARAEYPDCVNTLGIHGVSALRVRPQCNASIAGNCCYACASRSAADDSEFVAESLDGGPVVRGSFHGVCSGRTGCLYSRHIWRVAVEGALHNRLSPFAYRQRPRRSPSHRPILVMNVL